MKKLSLSLFSFVSVFFVSVGTSEVIFSTTFQTQLPGERPVFDIVRPSGSNTANVGAVIVDGNSSPVAGFGPAGNHSLRLWDRDPLNQAGVEHNFASSALTQLSAVRLDFNFQRSMFIDTQGDSLDSLYVMLGAYNTGQTLNNQDNRAFELRINNDGTFRIRHGLDESVTLVQSIPSPDQVNGFSIFANSGHKAFQYEGPDGVNRQLNANSFSVYLNQTLVGENHEFLRQIFHDQENILGKFGFRTGNANARTNVDFLVDDIVVSVIPEPRTYAIVFGIGALGLAWVRRRAAIRLTAA